MDREQSERNFARSLEHWRRHGFGKRSLVEKATGAWLGFVELAHVGPEAVEVSLERVGLERVIARFQPENAASGRITEKLGMRFERDATGRDRESVRIHALSRAEWRERSRVG